MGIAFVELLEALWGIDPERLAAELGVDAGGSAVSGLARLTREDRRELADFARFLAARRTPPAP
jgi:hypothetical protein